MELLKTLLLVYSAMLLINALLSAVCWRLYRERLYLHALVLWLGTFVTAASEAIFQHSHLAMVLSFSTYFFCSIALVRILAFVTRQRLPWRGYVGLMAVCLATTVSFAAARLDFVLIALPAAIGVTFPMLHAAIRTLLAAHRNADRDEQASTRIYCWLLIVNSLHFIDFPFLRLHPEFAVLGFTLALGLLMAFSIYLPAYIVKSLSDAYTRRISKLNHQLIDYQSRVTDLLALAQVGELSFSFVHDMASPTTLLMFYSKEIAALQTRGPQTSDELAAYSKGIEQATSRLLKLQKTFRALVKNETLEEPERVDLRDSVRSCVDLFHPFLRKSGTTIEVTGEAESVTAFIVPGMFERVLLNLLQNAVNALADRSIREIRISLRHENDRCEVLVSDTGPGIAPERLKRLWERFGHSETGHRAGTSARDRTAAQVGGSGFGLYEIRNIMRRIGGEIEVVESSANGTTFRVTVPAATEEIPSTPTLAA